MGPDAWFPTLKLSIITHISLLISFFGGSREAGVHSFEFLGVTASILLVLSLFLSHTLHIINRFSFSSVYLGNGNFGWLSRCGLWYMVFVLKENTWWERCFAFTLLFFPCVYHDACQRPVITYTVLLSIIMTEWFGGDITVHWPS
jgi:hypothetical protein